jgi:hypothetical protein
MSQLVSQATPSLSGEGLLRYNITIQWFVLVPRKSWGVNELLMSLQYRKIMNIINRPCAWLETTALLQGKFPCSACMSLLILVLALTTPTPQSISGQNKLLYWNVPDPLPKETVWLARLWASPSGLQRWMYWITTTFCTILWHWCMHMFHINVTEFIYQS